MALGDGTVSLGPALLVAGVPATGHDRSESAASGVVRVLTVKSSPLLCRHDW
ncbi:hypothetical protein Ga0074812_101464 [Parafrankia irregularis]|uniref:Uncharacterized protein n=1 Tax=Parafrankia irregularis TaxID=795642 RepID=A0A0S4QED4_9ACTN|nr:hypothetical protein Ga0074812_101464 [Parafrankia irregularis]